MKQLIVTTMIAASMILPASGSETRRDGNWWRAPLEGGSDTANDSFKTAYMVGLMDGKELGQFMCTFSKQLNTDSFVGTMKLYLQNEKLFDNVTISQTMDGLNKFYQDYRNRSIKVIPATWIVINLIKGNTEEATRSTEYSRKNP